MNQPQITIKGLHTKSNPLTAPQGTFSYANNVVVDAGSECRPRRGFNKYGAATVLAGGARIREVFEFGDKIHFLHGNVLAYDTDDAGTWADYTGTYDALVTNVGVRHAVYDGTLYLTTTAGVMRTAAVGTAPVTAGLPRCLPIKAVLSVPVTGSSGFFATTNQVAYRVTYRRKDANDRVLESAPSGRAVVVNTVGARDVTLTIYLSSGVVAGDKIAIFRSLLSGAATTEPPDDLYLCYEYDLVAGDITAGLVTLIDDVKQEALSDRIYTSDEGIDQSNFRPPVCSDIEVFKNHGFFARTRQPHRLIIRLQKVFKTSVSPGLTSGNTLVIGGVTYTANSTEGNENLTTGVFWVDEASTDARERIMNTAMSLCRVVNGVAANTILYAFYEGEFAADPGLIVFERRDFTDTAFVMTAGQAAAGASFSPILPTSGTTVTSTADLRKNGLGFSKPYQLDCVPLGNELLIGDEAEELVRVIACRSALWIFTVSGKVYRLVGDNAQNWQVSLFDASTKVWGARTVTGVESGVVLMTTRGVVLCTDSGINEVGDPIDDQTAGYVSLVTYPNFQRDAFAFNYSSDKCWIMVHSQTAFCWCYDTNAWTTWSITADGGFVRPSNDRIYFARSDGYIRQERKANTKFDFADQDTAVTVVSRSGFDVVLASVTGVTVGQGLYQSDTCYGVITVVTVGTSTVTLDRVASWTAGAAAVYDGIECSVLWNPLTGGNPGGLKRYKEVVFLWRHSDGPYTGRLTTNFDGTYTEITITPQFQTAGFGRTPFGPLAWGGTQGGQQANRMAFPIAKIRGLWTQVGVKDTIPWSAFKLSGFVLTYDQTGGKFNEAMSA